MPRLRPKICRCQPHLRAATAEAAQGARTVQRGACAAEERGREPGSAPAGASAVSTLAAFGAATRDRRGARVSAAARRWCASARARHTPKPSPQQKRGRGARAHRRPPPPSRPPAAPPWPPARALRRRRRPRARQPATKARVESLSSGSSRRRRGCCAQPRAPRAAVCPQHAASARGGTHPARPQRRRRAAGPPPAPCRPPPRRRRARRQPPAPPRPWCQPWELGSERTGGGSARAFGRAPLFSRRRDALMNTPALHARAPPSAPRIATRPRSRRCRPPRRSLPCPPLARPRRPA